MHVYDFDKTIYDGDCTVDFYLYCLKKYKPVRSTFGENLIGAIGWKTGLVNKRRFKNCFLGFIDLLPDYVQAVEEFWDDNQHKIKKFYLEQQQIDDVIISASPDFLIVPICKRLGVHGIATKYDTDRLVMASKNCYAMEKVYRYRELYGNKSIEEFYSDSLSDAPMARLARKSFLVKGDKIIEWPEDKKKGGYWL